MKQPAEHKQEKERCILVGISTPKVRNWMASEQLAELGRLAETAGAVVVKSFLQRVQNFNPATLIGEGKVNEVKRALEEENAKMVVFDDDLSGSQVRNLEERLPGIKVLDKNFIDEANTRSFYEDGSWTGNDKERMYQKARRMMLQKGFSAQNRKKAEETARQQLTKFFRSFGYNNVELTFGK